MTAIMVAVTALIREVLFKVSALISKPRLGRRVGDAINAIYPLHDSGEHAAQ
jgi:hypothetical protein